jgi:hypothetical protein
MKSSSTEFYEWLIRVTNLIRAQPDPHEQELFKIFAASPAMYSSLTTLPSTMRR